MLADQLGAGIPEEALGLRVDELDGPRLVDDDQRIGGGVEKCGDEALVAGSRRGMTRARPRGPMYRLSPHDS